MELSAAEVSHLLTLSGFDVLSTRGAWSCQLDGTTLGLEERLDDPALLARRIGRGADRPDEAFIWWVNAARADRPPDAIRLRTEVQALFERHWPRRVCRGMRGLAEGSVVLSADAPDVASLPFPIARGPWALSVEHLDPPGGEPAVNARILSPGGEVLHDLRAVDAVVEGSRSTWKLDQPELVFACSLVVELAAPTTEANLRLPVELWPADRRFEFEVSSS